MQIPKSLLVGSAAITILALSGCNFSVNKGEKGKSIDFSTPLGGMSVRTNQAASVSALGITPYPGSRPARGSDGEEGRARGDDRASGDDRANVDMHFGNFRLKVQTARFTTGDAPEKVLAFYRGELAQYGDVIECSKDTPVGTPVKTGQGLTCEADEKESHKHVRVLDRNHDDALELKAGSKRRQHIVKVQAKHAQTQITLVSLELPLGSDAKD